MAGSIGLSGDPAGGVELDDDRPPGFDARPGRRSYPNFDFIRLAAASSVIFSHSFLIGEGVEAHEPLARILGPHNIVGIYGVHCFFIMSGFLVTQSLKSSNAVLNFLWRRALRIYPGLFVCLAVCGFLLAPAFSSRGALDYYRGIASLRYISGNLLFPGQPWSIGGVEFYHDAGGWLGRVINGSLWTIFHELLCYVLIAVLAASGRLTHWLAGLLAIAFVAAGITNIFAAHKVLSDFVFVAPGFFAGAALCMTSVPTTRGLPRMSLVAAAALGLICAWRLGVLMQVFPLAAAAPILLIATSDRFHLPSLARLGDISYGTYLYGWPVEQVVRSQLGPHSSWALVFALSLIGAYGVGFASWRLIEQPALRYKRWVFSF